MYIKYLSPCIFCKQKRHKLPLEIKLRSDLSGNDLSRAVAVLCSLTEWIFIVPLAKWVCQILTHTLICYYVFQWLEVGWPLSLMTEKNHGWSTFSEFKNWKTHKSRAQQWVLSIPLSCQFVSFSLFILYTYRLTSQFKQTQVCTDSWLG